MIPVQLNRKMFITCIENGVSWGINVRNESPEQHHTEYDITYAECNMIYSSKKDTATGEMITYAVRRLLLFTKMIWVSIVTGMVLVSLHDRCDGEFVS